MLSSSPFTSTIGIANAELSRRVFAIPYVEMILDSSNWDLSNQSDLTGFLPVKTQNTERVSVVYPAKLNAQFELYGR